MLKVKMGFYSIIFGAFLEFIILQTANSDIPGCHFLETVNITSSQGLQNGSHLYHDLEIPVHLTGQYEYLTTELEIYEASDSHLRGCVCQLKPCIWICCRFKDWDASNGKCTDGLMEELSEINPFLNVTLSNGSVVIKNLLSDFIVLRDRVRWDDIWVENNYTMLENGSVLFNFTNTINFRGYDCLHPNQFTSGNTESFVAAFHRQMYYWKAQIELLPIERELRLLSKVFLALTIAVYLCLRKLRNLHGKCFICYMITTLLHFINVSLETVQIPLQLCSLRGYFKYLFFMAKYNWLLALSHQLWRGFTSVNRAESQYSFGAYSIFAWGSSAILTGALFLIDQILDGVPHKMKWMSGIGWLDCNICDWSYFRYIILPMVILVALNTALFILTIISIIRVKLSLRHFSEQDERARNLKSRMQTYKVFLRLSVVMDIQWSVRVISNFSGWNLLLTICQYCDACIGIIIFMLFVLKRTTLNLLVDS